MHEAIRVWRAWAERKDKVTENNIYKTTCHPKVTWYTCPVQIFALQPLPPWVGWWGGVRERVWCDSGLQSCVYEATGKPLYLPGPQLSHLWNEGDDNAPSCLTEIREKAPFMKHLFHVRSSIRHVTIQISLHPFNYPEKLASLLFHKWGAGRISKRWTNVSKPTATKKQTTIRILVWEKLMLSMPVKGKCKAYNWQVLYKCEVLLLFHASANRPQVNSWVLSIYS